MKTNERQMMRRYLITACLLVMAMVAYAQGHIFKGASTYTSDILYTWDGKRLYRGNSTYQSDTVLTYDGKHVYKGQSSYRSDILLTTDATIPIALLASMW